MKKLFCILSILCVAIPLFSQKDLIVNGLPVENTCMYIRTVQGSIDTMQGKWVGIYNAEINADCLELGILYGGCKPDMEFVTNGEVQSSTLTFLLKYNSYDRCKDTLKTKLKFDLLPFKNMRPGKILFISFKGSPFNLSYLQRQ